MVIMEFFLLCSVVLQFSAFNFFTSPYYYQ